LELKKKDTHQLLFWMTLSADVLKEKRCGRTRKTPHRESY